MVPQMLVPDWAAKYQKKWLPNDLAAGASTWAVLVPLALSIAGLVGVDPVVGLYGLPLALLGYALFGGQRVVVMGPDAAIAILTGSVVASLAIGPDAHLSLVVLMSFLIGALYIVFRLLKLGWITDLLPDPVLKGFTEGIIWLTIVKQLYDIFGVQRVDGNSDALGLTVGLFNSISGLHITTALVGGASLAALVLLRILVPRLPGPLLVVIAAMVLSWVLGLGQNGVAVLGEFDGYRQSFTLPSGLGKEGIATLLSGALAIAVLGFTKSQPALGKASDYSGDALDQNRELLALGATNIGAGLGGGYPIGASLTATTVSVGANAKSQVSNLFAGLLCFGTVLFLLPLLSPLPETSLAAIIIVSLAAASNPRYLFSLLLISRREFAIALAAFGGVLAFGVLPGVLIGVVLALFNLAYQIHAPTTTVVGQMPSGGFADIDEHPGAQEIEGLLITHHYGPIVYLNSRTVTADLIKAVDARPKVRVVILDATASSGLDSSAAAKLLGVRDKLAALGKDFWVVNPRNNTITLAESLLKSKGRSDVPEIFDTIQDAIAAFRAKKGSGEDASDSAHD